MFVNLPWVCGVKSLHPVSCFILDVKSAAGERKKNPEPNSFSQLWMEILNLTNQSDGKKGGFIC